MCSPSRRRSLLGRVLDLLAPQRTLECGGLLLALVARAAPAVAYGGQCRLDHLAVAATRAAVEPGLYSRSGNLPATDAAPDQNTGHSMRTFAKFSLPMFQVRQRLAKEWRSGLKAESRVSTGRNYRQLDLPLCSSDIGGNHLIGVNSHSRCYPAGAQLFQGVDHSRFIA